MSKAKFKVPLPDQANARLIAAAPELLAALRAVGDYIIDTKAAFSDHWDGEDEESFSNVMDWIDAAIAKAEGRSETILVAFCVMAKDRAEAQRLLMNRLPDPEADCHNVIDCWWIAEEDRIDGSDNDSAVFVPYTGAAQ